jgi:DNA replication and repair protein RecF
VVHTPDDIALVKGSPQLRRQYLDIQIAQASPLYLHHLARYQRAMRQRNQLLRQRTSITIEAWEHEMASAAAYIVQQRAAAVDDLSARACSLYHILTKDSESLCLHYRTGAPIEEGLQALACYYVDRYEQHRQREMELGLTSTGPHKDDLTITIQGKGSRSFASEGQQRSCVAAMRLAEWQRLKEQANQTPLLLIDDVAISLDQGRRQRLLDMLGTFGQVFLSSAYDLAPHLNPESVRCFKVAEGRLLA